MMSQNYWQWPETVYQATEIDWKNATEIKAGIDMGTSSAQAAVFCDGKLFAYGNICVETDFKETARKVIEKTLQGTGMKVKDITSGIMATGWGAKSVEYATDCIDEISAHAKGARFMYGKDVHTVVDLGGQTIKAIRLYDWDRVRDFAINDKCTTGMGRNMEVVCDMLQIPLTDIGELSLKQEDCLEPVSTTCHAFASAETYGLFGRPELKEKPLSEDQVYASYMLAVAWRILGVVGRLQPLDVGDVTAEKELAFTGGLAKNIGITKRLEKELKITAVTSEIDPQVAGAIGAALLV